MSGPFINAPASYNLTVGSSVTLSSIISFSGSIVSYDVYDLDASSGSAQGYSTLLGGFLPQGYAALNIPGSVSLSDLLVFAGTGINSNLVEFVVHDTSGLTATAFVTFNTIPPNSPPSVTSTGISATVNQVIAGTALFTVSDPDHDAISAYEIWDPAGGGYFAYYGERIATNQWVQFADLRQLTYTASSQAGIDTYYVAASDYVGFGNYTLASVQTIRTTNVASVVTASNLNATQNQWFSGSALGVQVTDADGDTPMTYKITDTNGAVGSAQLWFNGSYLGQGASITVTAAQWSSSTGLWVQGGSNTGTDGFTVQVNDGYIDSNTASFNIVTRLPNRAPTVAQATPIVNANVGQSVAAGSLIGYTDADGDAMVTYRFWDNGVGGGHFSLNGVTQAAGQNIDVSAANLANLTYVGASAPGSEVLYAQVFDGTAWSAWQSWNQATLRGSNTASVVSAGNINASQNQWFSGSALGVVVTDADGDTPVTYKITDTNSAAGSAQLWFNGSYLAQGASVTVTAAQWSSSTGLWVQGGVNTGTDGFTVQVNDGYTDSNTASFNIVTRLPNRAPVVTLPAGPPTVTVGNSVAAGSLIGYTDADGDAMVTYRFWDNGVGGGHFSLSGVTQAAGQNIDVSAANLANLTYVGASAPGSEVLYAQVFDGIVWSAWQSWNQATLRGSNTASVVTAGNINATQNQWFSGSALGVAVTDADGDTPVTYKITDTNSTDGSARLWFNGSYLAQGASVTVTAAQWSSGAGLWVQGGVNTGTDGFTVQVNDGYADSNTASFNIVTRLPNRAPVVTLPASTPTVTVGNSVAAGSLIGYTDADGDAMVTYRFWDNGVGGGHFSLSGVTQAAGQNIDVSAANLANLTYVGASAPGSEVLYAQVFDGIAWSAWQSWNQATLRGTNTASVVSASNVNATQNQWFSGSALGVAVTDADGDTPVSYTITDTNSTAGSARLWFNGSYLAQGASVTVTAAQWSSGTGLWVQGGVNTGTDGFTVKVNDGYVDSNTASFNIATKVPNRAPVISTAGSLAVHVGDTLAASSLFSATDADGDPIVTYRFWDGGFNIGSFYLNGIAQSPGRNIDISPADLANLTYMVGETGVTTSETLSFQAYDGTVWSDWKGLAVTSYYALPTNVVQGLRMNDDLTNVDSDSIVLGGGGTDRLGTGQDSGFSILIGGGENTWYFVSGQDNFSVIDNYHLSTSGSGRLITNFDFAGGTLGVAQIDGKHLLLEDQSTGQDVIIINWQDAHYQFSSVESNTKNADITLSWAQFISALPSVIPNADWSQLGIYKADIDSLVAKQDALTSNGAYWGGWMPAANSLDWFTQNELDGTAADDTFLPDNVISKHALVGGRGDNSFATFDGSSSVGSPQLFVGGLGQDSYFVGKNRAAIVLAKDDASSDKLTFAFGSTSLDNLKFAIIDGRHLEIVANDGDSFSPTTAVLILDWQKQGYQIGTVDFRISDSDPWAPSIATFSYSSFVQYVNSHSPAQLSWADIGMDGTEANQTIAHYESADVDQFAPVVTPQQIVVPPGEGPRVDKIALITDQDGDSITKYEVRVTDATHGYLKQGDTDYFVDGDTDRVLSAADAATTYVFAASSSDHWQIRAYDGAKWSDWASFTVDQSGAAPVDNAPYLGNSFTPTASPQSVTDWVGNTDANDGYTFTINSSGVLTLNFSGLDDNITFYMGRESEGHMRTDVASISGEIPVSVLGYDFYHSLSAQGGTATYNVTPGTYRLEVMPYSPDHTAYQLSFALNT